MKDQKKETKELILTTARDIFAELGYDGARVDMIAEKAGINKAGIYYHIGGKEKLYEAVLHKTFENIFDDIIRKVEKKNSPEEKLRVYINELLKNMEKYPYIPRIMIREIASGGKNVSVTLAIEFLKIIACISKILKQGEKEGVFIEASPLTVHFMIVSTNTYLFLLDPGKLFSDKNFEDFSLENTNSDTSRKEIENLVVRALLKNKVGSGYG